MNKKIWIIQFQSSETMPLSSNTAPSTQAEIAACAQYTHQFTCSSEIATVATVDKITSSINTLCYRKIKKQVAIGNRFRQWDFVILFLDFVRTQADDHFSSELEVK